MFDHTVTMVADEEKLVIMVTIMKKTISECEDT